MRDLATQGKARHRGVLDEGEATLILRKIGSKQELTSELRAAGIDVLMATQPKTRKN